jgi:beta-galactosidase/beta-glucuronidase
MTIPRNEYPRPQFAREQWLCLNGTWQFEIDSGDSGLERGFVERELKDRITVPFCPESKLSGVEKTDFLTAVWYRRTVTIPESWRGKRVLLHFQAADYDATVWVNGKEVARHRGGFTPFSCDLCGIAGAGEELTIVVRARDEGRGPQPRGKQSQRFENYGCRYTRTTGIWQTVWMEPVPDHALRRPRITPDVANSAFHLVQPISRAARGMRLRATLLDHEGAVCRAECDADRDFAPQLTLSIPSNRRRLWSPHDSHLYDLEIDLVDQAGKVVDQARSYCGLRSITIDGKAVKLNGEVLFQRLVLDQGYYPDGIMTAPSDEALRKDIELGIAAGFNGARLHQKVFEERFLYHADRLGYLCWGEFGDWGAEGCGPQHDHWQPGATYITQWLEALERDYSHPCIVGWCPLNETSQALHDRTTVLDDVTRGMFLATKAMDPYRPVLDTSGYSHRVPEADIYDSHDYEQDPEKFRAKHAELANGLPFVNLGPGGITISCAHREQPYFVSEFGGIRWNPDEESSAQSWGYGQGPRTIDEFYDRFEKLCGVLLDDTNMFGYCYTQLTDVFQEQNGIYAFDRGLKFDMKRIRHAQIRKAAIEAEVG